VWVEDSVPVGAFIPTTPDNDVFTWASSNPVPSSGSLDLQSRLTAGLHQQYFYAVASMMPVAVGDTMVAYVYIDPTNPPSTICLQWNEGAWDWEHRAYWGANTIPWGANGTDSLRYMGPVPAAGQWVRLTVPASQVGLEGSVVNGMAFTLYNGRASWDHAGKLSAPGSTPTPTATMTPTFVTPPDTDVVWVEDSVPAGATVPTTADNNPFTWVNSNPPPISGSLALQSRLAAGIHQQYFFGASSTLSVNVGDTLIAYVFIDPFNPPSTICLQWNDGVWDHRAYWGANTISWGVNGTDSRRYMGPVPAAGQWVRLTVPASQVGLEGSVVNGMAFTLCNGRAAWDHAGRSPAVATSTPTSAFQMATNTPVVTVTNAPVSTATNAAQPSSTNAAVTTATNTPPGPTNTPQPPPDSDFVWVEDSVPTGASIPTTTDNDAFTWASSNPVPISGRLDLQSRLVSGIHQQYFYGATTTMPVNVGDTLVAYVFIDPANPPSTICLQWNEGVWDWEHRAYWGANTIPWGVSGTNNLRYMGLVPAEGQWVRLTVPASQVGLEGSVVNGMAFTLYNGRASWDRAGKMSAPGGTPIAAATATSPPPPNVGLASAQNSVPGETSTPNTLAMPTVTPAYTAADAPMSTATAQPTSTATPTPTPTPTPT
jgi:hypothetical protein